MEDVEGKLVKIEGRVSGSQPMLISWFKNESEIQTSDKYDVSFKSNVAVLCIKGSQVEDSGRYICRATNEAGQASCEVTVGISGKFPLIGGKPEQVQRVQELEARNMCLL